MRFDAGQHLRMDQRMKLAPRMIQSMEILQLPIIALEERIEQELSSNPTLELQDPSVDGEEEEREGQAAQEEAPPVKVEGEREMVVQDADPNQRDDFERLSNITEEYGEAWATNAYDNGESSYRRSSGGDDIDPKLEAMANTASRPASLGDQLLDQWLLVETTPTLRAAGEYLIGFIDDDGYLRTDMPELLAQAPPGLTQAHLEEALKLLQSSLEPIGLAARDLRECLLLQIDAKARQPNAPDLTVQRILVSEHLKDIEANRLPKIAQKMNLPVEDIKTGITRLRQFYPHPGRLLAEESPRNIIPDAIIEYDEVQDRYVARLTTDRTPTLSINSRYLRMSRDQAVDRKTREFVANNLRSARWLIEAIQQRQNTVLRVINVVLTAQREFFDHGPEHLKPLPMTTVADQLGIHVATVSRAVSEKYLQTPRGILPLRMFFSGGTATDDGESMSWTAVQAKLQQIIDAEDKSNPLSDDLLVDELKKQGIDIARRTIAKYRKQLHILPARQRREF